MANGILVFIEHADGKVNRASYEAVRAAQLIGAQTGQEISAVIFGQGVGEIAAEVATKKIKTVYTVESEWLKHYTADGYSHAFRQAVEQTQPALALMTHTYEARDFAPKMEFRRVHLPVKNKQTQFIEGSPSEIATKLLEKLKNEARVF